MSADNLDPDFVERRRVGLENFLLRVASHPVLYNDKIFFLFLTEVNPYASLVIFHIMSHWIVLPHWWSHRDFKWKITLWPNNAWSCTGGGKRKQEYKRAIPIRRDVCFSFEGSIWNDTSWCTHSVISLKWTSTCDFCNRAIACTQTRKNT